MYMTTKREKGMVSDKIATLSCTSRNSRRDPPLFIEKSGKGATHCPCQVTLQFFDNRWKASTREVQKFPTSPHAFPIPPWHRVLLVRFDISFLGMINIELQKRPKFKGMCEQEDYPVHYAHYCEGSGIPGQGEYQAFLSLKNPRLVRFQKWCVYFW